MGKWNRKQAIAVVIGSCLLVTGCQINTVPALTEEQTALVSEFAASLVLRYDANHENELANEQEFKEAEEMAERMRKREEAAAQAVQTASETDAGQSAEEVQEAVSYQELSQLLGLEGVTIAYQGYELHTSYPSGEGSETYFVLEAEEGNQLLVLKFSMSIIEEKEINIFDLAPSFQVRLNDAIDKRVLTTLLLNELSTFKATVTVDAPAEVVLLAEVTQEEADAITGITLKTTCGEASGVSLLQ